MLNNIFGTPIKGNSLLQRGWKNRALTGPLTIALFFFAPTAFAGTTAAVPVCKTKLSKQLKRLGVPGISIALIKNGELACTGTEGLSNLKKKTPVTKNTIFAWNSISKTVIATALMILFDEGRFSLDDNINKYLPYTARNPSCPGKPITFRHLLTHSSSIIDNDDVYDASYSDGDSPVILGTFLKDYLTPKGKNYSSKKNFQKNCPGKKYEYTNIGAGLIANLVENISKIPFDQFCQQRIFAPLKMSDTSFRLSKVISKNLAMPYYGKSKKTFEAVGHVGYATYPDGSLRSPTMDLYRFLAMMQNNGVFQGTRILKDSTAKEMKRIQNQKNSKTQGLIWFYDFGGKLGHDGSGDGAASLMFSDEKKKTGVLITTNGDFFENEAKNAENNAIKLLNTLFTEADNY